ncbi:unnamed protein product [Linum trigynum]|uniref:Uncharacterized protein n=2 Tax=Linum trigynum TaxID=586398 RepID=A0AAV2D8I1_9ROSI
MARFLGSCTGRPGRLHGRARLQAGRAPHAEEMHGQALKIARPCTWPCKKPEFDLRDTLRFMVHGQNGEVHGRAPWPCNSGNPVLKPNPSQKWENRVFRAKTEP